MSIPTLAWACVSVPLLVPPVGQDAERPNAAMRSVDGADPAVIPAGTLIAALPYDGISSWAHNAQDFEPEFDVFDIFLIEDIEPQTDAALVMFRSLALPNRDPAGAEDFETVSKHFIEPMYLMVMDDRKGGQDGQTTSSTQDTAHDLAVSR